MIRFLRKSFRTRLLLGFLAAALLPLILSSLVINSVFLNRQEMREQAEAMGEGSEKIMQQMMFDMPLGSLVSYGRMTSKQLKDLIASLNA